ncbi:MAG: hypothetical protein NVSMB1_26600 [Polyangiales bacterium]
MVVPGATIAGKYRVTRLIGGGGMGVVVEAVHADLERQVAIKFLLPSARLHPDAIVRFSREARAAARLRSEHVVRVLDIGTHEGGAPYIVMEYCEGSDLEKVLAERLCLPVSEAVDYILQACEALAEAHGLGIVHRDLKPANMHLGRSADGSPIIKLLDFGLSKLSPELGEVIDGAVTRGDELMGTPLYMSPEHMTSSATADSRCDVWALGAILYQLVTGRPPFGGDSLPLICARVLTEAPSPLSIQLPKGEEGIERVIARCLEKDVQDRFQNVAELATALADYAPLHSKLAVDRVVRLARAAGLSLEQLPSGPSANHSSAPPVSTESDANITRRSLNPRRNKTTAAVALVSAALAGASVFGAALQYRHMAFAKPAIKATDQAKTFAAKAVRTPPLPTTQLPNEGSGYADLPLVVITASAEAAAAPPARSLPQPKGTNGQTGTPLSSTSGGSGLAATTEEKAKEEATDYDPEPPPVASASARPSTAANASSDVSGKVPDDDYGGD